MSNPKQMQNKQATTNEHNNQQRLLQSQNNDEPTTNGDAPNQMIKPATQQSQIPRLIQSLIPPMANNQPKIPNKKRTQTRILPQNEDNNTTYGNNIQSTKKHHTTLRLYHQNI